MDNQLWCLWLSPACSWLSWGLMRPGTGSDEVLSCLRGTEGESGVLQALFHCCCL